MMVRDESARDGAEASRQLPRNKWSIGALPTMRSAQSLIQTAAQSLRRGIASARQ